MCAANKYIVLGPGTLYILQCCPLSPIMCNKNKLGKKFCASHVWMESASTDNALHLSTIDEEIINTDSTSHSYDVYNFSNNSDIRHVTLNNPCCSTTLTGDIHSDDDILVTVPQYRKINLRQYALRPNH